MAYGKIKADAIIRDNSGTDEEISMATIVTLDSGKAPKASPTFTGTVTMPATTALAGQASDITIVDNNAAALEVKEGSTAYVTFDTTNSSEQIEVAKKVQLAEDLEFSGAKDIKIVDSNASAFNVAEGSNNYVTFDTTDEQVEVNKKVTLDGDLQFMVASDILMTDNSSTALEVKEGSTSYMTFDTTNSAEQVEVNVPLVLNSTTELRLADTDSSNHIAIKAPGTVGSNVTLTLPDNDGDADDVLTTNGSGVLSWAAASSGKLGKVTCLESQTRTSVSTTPSGSAFSVVNILGMGNFTKATDTSALYIWGMSQGHGQQSGGGGFTIQVGSTMLDQAGHFTYPGGNYAVGVSWAGTVAAGGMNAGTYAITLGHRSNASNRPISILNPTSTNSDHNAYPPTGNGGTGTVIFVMEVEP